VARNRRAVEKAQEAELRAANEDIRKLAKQKKRKTSASCRGDP